jgi:hypothetical protein
MFCSNNDDNDGDGMNEDPFGERPTKKRTEDEVEVLISPLKSAFCCWRSNSFMPADTDVTSWSCRPDSRCFDNRNPDPVLDANLAGD